MFKMQHYQGRIRLRWLPRPKCGVSVGLAPTILHHAGEVTSPPSLSKVWILGKAHTFSRVKKATGMPLCGHALFFRGS